MLDYPGTLAVTFFASIVVGRMMKVLARIMRMVYERRVEDVTMS